MKKREVRVVKKHQRTTKARPAKSEAESKRRKPVTGIRSWVVEFQQRDRVEFLPAFDSLFKDLLPDQEDSKVEVGPLLDQSMEIKIETSKLGLN